MKKNIDTIYLKITIDKSDKQLDDLREQGLFFSAIADGLEIDRDYIEELDERGLVKEAEKLKKNKNNLISVFR
ncbi:MAG: hypothetical protein QM532_04330 [Cyanobium sp. MAG06]|nr:hypothetical protein [Cyanobium sp. MAG06]